MSIGRIVRLALVLLFSLSLYNPLNAQDGVVRFKEYQGGTDNSFDNLLFTQDSLYMAYGGIYNSGPNNLYAVVKYDAAFNAKFERVFPINFSDVRETADGGFIGLSVGYNPDHWVGSDLWLIKYDRNFNKIWEKKYGGFGEEIPLLVRPLPNGNTLVLSSTNSTDGDVIGKTTTDNGIWAIVVDGVGNILENKILLTTSMSYYTESSVTNDGGFIFTISTWGVAGAYGDVDIRTIKTDASLNVQWSKTIGGSSDDRCNDIRQLSTGEYVLCGSTSSVDYDFQGNSTGPFVLKMSATGNIIWSKVLNAWADADFYNVRELPGGEIAAIGVANSDYMEGLSIGVGHNDQEGALFKFDSNGKVLMSRAIGGYGYEALNDVIPAPNGNFIVCGYNITNASGGDYSGFPRLGGQTRSFVMELRDLNTIKGKVYIDYNNNKVKDAEDSSFNKGKVRAAKGNIGIETNLTIAPEFFISTDTGRYFTQIIPLNSSAPFPYDSTLYCALPKRKLTSFTGTGQVDSFDLRVVPAQLVRDLEITILPFNEVFIDNSIKYRIKLRNIGGKTIVDAGIALKFDSHLVFESSSKQVNSNLGDSLIWRFPSFGGKVIDSIDVVFHVNESPGANPGDNMKLAAYAFPIDTDDDPDDNTVLISSVIRKQSAAVTGLGLQFETSTSARLTRIIPYTIYYDFLSRLDSTNGKVVVYKDSKTSFSSAIPVPSVVQGDSIVWNIKDLRNSDKDTIVFNLKIADTPVAVMGDSIKNTAFIQLDLADSVMRISKRTGQRITGAYIMPDTVTTTLQHPHGIAWVRLLGNAQKKYVAKDVVAMPDSGFITIGSMGGGLDVFIARFDQDGHLVWKKELGGVYDDELFNVRKLNDSTFYACGYYNTRPSYTGSVQAWVIKFNDRGEILWQKMYGGSGDENAYAVEPTADGGCIFTGTAGSSDGDVNGFTSPYYNLWVVKLNSSGDIEWNKCYLFSQDGYHGMDIRTTSNGVAYYVICNISGNSFVMKIDANGNTKWQKDFYKKSYNNSISSLLAVENDNIVLVGNGGTWIDSDGYSIVDTSFQGTHGSRDVWVIKLDSAGTVLWDKYFGGYGLDFGNRVYHASDGGYLIATEIASSDGNITNAHGQFTTADGWLLKVDSSGKLIWQKSIGGTNNDQLYGVAELKDGSIVTVGSTNSNGNGDIYGLQGTQDALIVKVGRSNYVTGKVFVDKNGNHMQDADDVLYNKGLVILSKDAVLATGAVINGLYTVGMGTGTYTLKLSMADSTFYTIYPENPTINFDTYLNADTIDFALVPHANIKDLRIDLLPKNAARAGFVANYQLKCENNGPFTENDVTVKFIIDHRTTYKGSSVPYNEKSGDTLIWKIAQIEGFASNVIDIELSVAVPPVIMPGDLLELSAEILPVIGDLRPANNVTTFNQHVGVSYDPNDKIEVHGNDFNTRHVQDGDYLKYVIRFQNTGNDTAFTVYVRDTLSEKVNWNSLEMIAASHDYELKIKEGNKLEWRFNNILLPDSNINEPGSHGFIAYRIKPQISILAGDTVKNSASIYFDYNPPVLTNTAQSIVLKLTVLPAGMLSFEGKWISENIAGLNWVITNEDKVAYYSVQRSADGIVYEEIGQVQALNILGRNKYMFTDNKPLAGRNYYRIGIVDEDHSTVFSKIVLLKDKVRNEGQLLIHPNPSVDKTTLTLKVPVKGMGSIMVIDAKGSIVAQTALGYIDQQLWQKSLDVHNLPAGQYYIQCRIGETIWGGKFIKQ